MYPFVAGDTQEEAPCTEVADTAEDRMLGNAVIQLNTLGKTPVNIQALKQELAYYNPNEAAIILNGFMHGFPLNYVGPQVSYESKNLKSARLRPEITQQKIDKEVAEGRVAGPFSYPPFPNFPSFVSHRLVLLKRKEVPTSGSSITFPTPKMSQSMISLILSCAMLNMQALMTQLLLCRI